MIKEIAKKFLRGEGTLASLSQKYKIKRSKIKEELESQGYVIKSGYRLSTIIGLKLGVEEYITNLNNNPSITKICDKYKINRKTLSDRLKDLGYTVVNHQNKVKFNETVFDCIDTEEKAYWLGFIFADGYISNSGHSFELSLSIKDKNHLDKFNKFMQHINDNVKLGKVGNFERCRWSIENKHLWETLNSYGCTPNKSLTLQFPPSSIFYKKCLIKHFIRGYFDGDGCISYANKKHTTMLLHLLGTENFLSGVKNHLPIKFDYYLGFNKKSNNITRTLQIIGKNGLKILYYLYEGSSIYLDRKYDKYLEYCRLYKELYKLLSSNIGKIPDMDNTEIISENNTSETSYSIENEPIDQNIISPRVLDIPTEISG